MNRHRETPVGQGHVAGIESDIPARLDRLPWSRFHWLLVTALGVTWVLDGLEVTIVGVIGPMLEEPAALGLRADQIGLSQTLYLAGAIGGALWFGHLTDRLGRKRLFSVTLFVYLAGAIASAFAWNFASFALFRCITGMAIGGEYSAINSAIDELIPARVRGQVDLAINSTFWAGAIAGAAAGVVLLDPNLLPVWLGWRLSFGLGAVVAGAMILVRRYVPESPRWLLTHGRQEEAEAVMESIEAYVADHSALAPIGRRIKLYPGAHIGFGTIAQTLLVRCRSRALLGLVLIASQAFFYNGISNSYPLVLKHYFGVPPERAPVYAVCMATANLLGPLLLGRLFDTVGGRGMISGTYAFSGVVIIVSEILFFHGRLTAETQTLLWAVTFFFASAAASGGYLTVSEVFPVEMRALAIALFYAVGTAIGGLAAPAFFGVLIQWNRADLLAYGYLVGAELMILAAVAEVVIGVSSERKALEDVAAPLTAEQLPIGKALEKAGSTSTIRTSPEQFSCDVEHHCS